MDKRILILGCICSVAILIGVSFTSVVGHSNVKSNYVRASPLYNVRTNRVIGENSLVFTHTYVGNGKENTIYIPTPDIKRTQIIKKIREMNNGIFDRFVGLVIKYVNNDAYKFENINTNKLIKMLYQLREKSEMLNYADLPDTTKPLLCEIVDLLLKIVDVLFLLFILGPIIIILRLLGLDPFESMQCKTCGEYCSYCIQ